MRKKTMRLLAFWVLLLLLVGCAGGPEQWQDWLGDLLARPAPTVGAPVDDRLQPTPTLATGDGARPTATSGALAPAGDATDTPAEDDAPIDPDEDEATTEEFGPFTGTFEGVMVGDNDSSAPLELQLVQRGRHIEGAASLGDGLIVRAGGVCGSFPIPAMVISAVDELDHANERSLSATTTVNVSGFDIPVALQANLDADGNTVIAEATMYPPALCGANPTVAATLTRVVE